MNSFIEKPDISVILTAHKEGILSALSARSALAAVEHARSNAGLLCEMIVVLDNSSKATQTVLRSALGTRAVYMETEYGDPGQARNAGIGMARAPYSTFIDGDDLWSSNWLSAAWSFAQSNPEAICHSQCNLVFGDERNLWWHIDSDGPFFDNNYLKWANYWDAMSFARTDVYRHVPFKPNDLKIGFGHEDWQWNIATLDSGFAHKPIAGTMHFKRRRKGSQMSRVALAGGVVWPT